MDGMRDGTDRLDMERYLHSNIPLARAMGVGVKQAGIRAVVLTAPLAPNINHHRTLFGGSAVAIATLAAWSLLHLRLRRAAIPAELVIQRSSMEYDRPIAGEVEAVCRFEEEPAWERFRTLLERRGRARLTLTTQLLYGGAPMAAFSGDFVAIRNGEAPTA